MLISNPKTRKAIYAVVIAMLAGSFVYGVISPDQLSDGIKAASEVAALLATILAVLNVPSGGGEV